MYCVFSDFTALDWNTLCIFFLWFRYHFVDLVPLSPDWGLINTCFARVKDFNPSCSCDMVTGSIWIWFSFKHCNMLNKERKCRWLFFNLFSINFIRNHHHLDLKTPVCNITPLPTGRKTHLWIDRYINWQRITKSKMPSDLKSIRIRVLVHEPMLEVTLVLLYVQKRKWFLIEQPNMEKRS